MVHRTHLLAGLLILVAGSLSASSAEAACDCATSTQAPYCKADPGETLRYSSPRGTAVSVTLGSNQGASDYVCGQYATGDYWVVGLGSPRAVKVASTSPGLSGAKNGWDVNPINNRKHSWDNSRWGGRTPPSLANSFNTGSGPVSFIKTASRADGGSDPNWPCLGGNGDEDQRTCMKTAMIVTFVNSIPDTDGDNSTADEFRPSPAGTNKITGINIDAAMVARIKGANRYSNTGGPSFAAIAKRFRTPEMPIQTAPGVLISVHYPLDEVLQLAGGRSATYQSTIASTYSTAVARFLMNDFSWDNPTHRDALIQFIQTGLDLAGAMTGGPTRWNNGDYPNGSGYSGNGNGGHHQGQRLPIVFAGWLTDDDTVKGLGSDRAKFFEGDAIYEGPDGVVYWGITGDLCNSSNANGEIHCRNKTRRMDSICYASGGPTNQIKSYSDYHPNHSVINYFLAMSQGIAPNWRHDEALFYYCTWEEGGREPGHTGFHWAGKGSGNVSSCSNRLSAGARNFGSGTVVDFWEANKSNVLSGGQCIRYPYDGSAPPPPPPPASPDPLTAPVLLQD